MPPRLIITGVKLVLAESRLRQECGGSAGCLPGFWLSCWLEGVGGSSARLVRLTCGCGCAGPLRLFVFCFSSFASSVGTWTPNKHFSFHSLMNPVLPARPRFPVIEV